MKIVVNRCYGGFGLSAEACLRYKELGGEIPEQGGCVLDYTLDRTDPLLVQVVEEMGAAANSFYADLEVVEVPDDVTNWRIDEYDGNEWVAEGRTW